MTSLCRRSPAHRQDSRTDAGLDAHAVRPSAEEIDMATFVSVATCHHCPVTSSRRGLVYRDSLSALSARSYLRGLGPQCNHHRRSPRVNVPGSIAVAPSKPPGSQKQLLVAHLRKLLTLRGL
ncbi:hypothetical protein Q5P01_011844 [Channa striata]|uniref:Uncharacterized protein n=1 Tax=Channa striata TaxID=64152 RepID=A0AA88SNB7_CHASR|nr:hypothetical protein Q5P01_011844 [Channa striata]